jgi:hypothetical protein
MGLGLLDDPHDLLRGLRLEIGPVALSNILRQALQEPWQLISETVILFRVPGIEEFYFLGTIQCVAVLDYKTQKIQDTSARSNS